MGKKLLLADDSITIQKVIGITFANEDYALEIVDNGDAAFEKAKSDRPDLILADVYMPGKNGYELSEALKADAALAGVPVLLLTGTFEPFDEERARAVGADDWIAKPFESQALIDKVEALLASGAQAPPAEPAEAPKAPAPEPEPQLEPEMALEDDSDFDSLLTTPGDEPLDEPQTWASEPEEAPEEIALGEESGFEAEFETAEEDEDLWGSVSLEEESLMDEFAEEEPAGEDLWGTLNDELAVTEPEEEAVAEPSVEPEVPVEEQEQDQEEVLPLDETDILEAEELSGAEDQEMPVFGEDAETFGPAEEESDTGPVAEEGFSFEDEENLFLGEAAEEPAVEESLISPAEALAAEKPDFEMPEAEEEPLPGAASAAGGSEAAVEQQVQALSDEDLNRIVEQVASRVLEKIAWEVVPDLAENMIKEEIRKLKEGNA
ncbi:MAG: response regulator [Desulfuromonadales bacterium]|nr:response regulator [Desulfuromonadales bacterium]NIS41354.1 response regulator [Desulfuromonadales bacterium]